MKTNPWNNPRSYDPENQQEEKEFRIEKYVERLAFSAIGAVVAFFCLRALW